MKNPKDIMPAKPSKKGGLYNVPDREESAQKISAILNKSNALLFESLGHNVNIHDLDQLTESTRKYFEFCAQQGIMPL